MKTTTNNRLIIFLVGFFNLISGCSSSSVHSTDRAPSSQGVAKRVLIPIPNADFDPTEAAVPWTLLKAAGFEIVFATENGQPGSADPAEVTGEGLGILSKFIAADKNGRAAYAQLKESDEFNHPFMWSQVRMADFDAIYLPGGHAPGMQPYLRSAVLQKLIADFFAADKPVGAICHGSLLVARSTSATTGKSVLFGRKTTSLTNFLELTGYAAAKISGAKNAKYFRTDSETVEDQIKPMLATPDDYITGPKSLIRDSPSNLSRGFFVIDHNYISARWPGDAFHFGTEFVKLISTYHSSVSLQAQISQ